MTLIFRLIIRRDIWIFHSKVFSSDQLGRFDVSWIQTDKQTNSSIFSGRIVFFLTVLNICYQDIGSLFSSEDMSMDDGYLRLNLLNCPNTSKLKVVKDLTFVPKCYIVKKSNLFQMVIFNGTNVIRMF